MKTLSVWAAVAFATATAFALETESGEAAIKTLSPRTASRRAASLGAADNIRVADRQSEVNATLFAANQMTRAFFDYTGFYLALGGGYAQMNAGNFTETNSYRETLGVEKSSDHVGFGRMEICYQFDENLDLGVGWTKFGTAEVQLAFPKYPNIASILPLPSYSRHVMRYDVNRYTLAPTFSFEAGDWLRLQASAGVTWNDAKSHIEATYQAWFSGRPSGTFSESYVGARKRSFSGMVSAGAECELLKYLSLCLSLEYAPFSVAVPGSRSLIGEPWMTPNRSSIRVDSFDAVLMLRLRR